MQEKPGGEDNLAPRTQADMRRLLAVVEEVRRLHPRMELSQLSIFLRVALEPGILAQEITKGVGLHRSSLSRNVGGLTTEGYTTGRNSHRVPGLGLIDRREEGLARPLRLTRKGRELASGLSDRLTG